MATIKVSNIKDYLPSLIRITLPGKKTKTKKISK